ncbi:ABC-type multidrug transport system ATPase subunit [Flavobacterium endophyticum]|uniref:ABC-type multidrug transport system ATPase subunit n=1 Tax=Flavobacterium endophyticum TaxID=1540163 RepID=A0A495MDK6_9FLAO|nr:ABC transporter ATP-binding protein [Flavobacterium endophyticum]RKS23172.1 ABC-type multidrug transport system ATPase subunit [Flavobacterium endophyticum]
MNSLQIKNLSKKYDNGVQAMQDISLEISNGIFGLLGPNGAGKSTLMKTIAGLQAPDSGAIVFNSVDVVADPTFIKQQLGYLPQDFGVYPKISAYDLLEHLAVLKGVGGKKERKEHIYALLEKTNLYADRNKAVSSFSGGMRQRFGVAQALLGNPQLIIVDEPTAGLDPEERNRFNNLLSEIGEQVIVILSTHLVEDVRNLCTQMAIINKGKVLAYGNPAAFIDELEGCIWTKAIEKKELSAYQEQFQVIATQLNAGRQHIHILSKENPHHGFAMKQTDLEDVYFAQLFNTK